MSKLPPSNPTQSITIAEILERRYRSLLWVIGGVMTVLAVSLGLMISNGFLRQLNDSLAQWSEASVPKLEEALFLKNFHSIGLRTSHVSANHDSIAETQIGLFGADRVLLAGALPFPEATRTGCVSRLLGLSVSCFETLHFGGKSVGFLAIHARLKARVVVLAWVVVLGLCLALFLLLRRLLGAFTATVDKHLAHPVACLRREMSAMELSEPTRLGLVCPGDATLEIRELYAGFSELMERVRSGAELEVKRAEAEADLKVASQVAHDIRSPLTALAVVMSDMNQLPEGTRVLMKGAISRIQDIANGLLSRRKGMPPAQREEARPSHLASLIESILAEKRSQFGARGKLNFEFISERDAGRVFAEVEPIELKRVLSNLLDNAAESIEGEGRVTVSLARLSSTAEIRIRDTGRGMPAPLIARVLQTGGSFAKPGGTGLGLQHARATVERWKGSLSLDSQLGKGTEVCLSIPRCAAPPWFIAEIEIPSSARVVIADDDVSIHRAWDCRLGGVAKGDPASKVLHFQGLDEVRAWSKKRADSEPALFLVDYEFSGEKTTGLDLIEELGIGKQSVLVTSWSDNPKILRRCQELGVRLIPKSSVPSLPIRLV